MVRAMLYTSSRDMLPVCWTEEVEGSRAVEGMDRRDNVEMDEKQHAHLSMWWRVTATTVKSSKGTFEQIM